MPGTNCKEAENVRDVLGLSKTSKHSGRTEAEIVEDKLKDIKSHKEQYNEMAGDLANLVTPVNVKTMTKNPKTNEVKPQMEEKVDEEKPSTSSAANMNSMGTMIAMQTDVAEPQQWAEVGKMFPDEGGLFVNEDTTVDEGLVLSDDLAEIEIQLMARKIEESLSEASEAKVPREDDIGEEGISVEPENADPNTEQPLVENVVNLANLHMPDLND
ncbi:uncharacterized protein LOC108103719 [Drosophila eugracilis]|uniref:uncharacterized protein LOC108103719 n=1 Tax=Drosophila eugracilis TaxID=29029 RepID=UPI0007E6EFEC|nr:uncharacterized protein LOC108103719 [Drosophila eugracilis]XP_017064805.1 uncharacterized protein LOC108103719 [Drosophila eugracilis]XP_017064806.1 uncharacterized protein LOC108103719 [Drosophila eugracilis]XP_017064807.1 uncharacterized protein LOC108103719 [Drosophila eugracilis]